MSFKFKRIDALFFALEACLWVGSGWALWRGQTLLSALVITVWVITMPWTGCPLEVGFSVLAAAMALAYAQGQIEILFVVAPQAIARNFSLLYGLQRGLDSATWTQYFIGPSALTRWSSATYAWRARGQFIHRLAWLIALATGLAWTAALWFLAFSWDSWWRWPFVVVCSLFAVWWMSLGLRALKRKLGLDDDRHAAPYDWRANMFRGARGEPEIETTTELDLQTGFADSDDPLLRLFAADCAEYALAAGESTGISTADATRAVKSARRRARDELKGRLLKLAFADSWHAANESFDWLDADLDADVTQLMHDGACAAYHALCAPTSLAAARLAAHYSSTTSDGRCRTEELAWQTARLDHYRTEARSPAQAA